MSVAGAKGAPVAHERQHAHIRVVVKALQAIHHLKLEFAAEGVEFLRTVETDAPDAVGYVIFDEFVSHWQDLWFQFVSPSVCQYISLS